MPKRISATEVDEAAERIAPWIRRTPNLRVDGPGARPIVLKLESLQRSGSFKLRGALNKLLILDKAAADGVITASGGNHGLGVAWAALVLQVPVEVFVPSSVPPIKRTAIEAANATIRVIPGGYPEAAAAATSHAEATGKPYIHAYDDPAVIAGQGTCIAEMLADAPDLRTIVVAIGGGGLAAGAVLAAKRRRVVGVEPFGAATMHAALRAGRPVELDELDSVAADSLGAGKVGRWTFAVCKAGLDRVELVDDQAMLDAQHWLWEHLRFVVEPGAAIGIAALSEGLIDGDPGPVGIILSGANADLGRLCAKAS